jgi:hypothetical protein
MNSSLHHTVVVARLMDYRRTADVRRLAHRAPPPRREDVAPRTGRTLRHRILRIAA